LPRFPKKCPLADYFKYNPPSMSRFFARRLLFGLRRISVDLGTANTVICDSDGQILLSEPSVLVWEERKGGQEVYAVGHEASRMVGRTPRNLRAVRPVTRGVVADFGAAEAMLRHFLRKAMPGRCLRKTDAIVCVPANATGVELRAFREVVERQPGFQSVWTVPESLAAAVGSDLPVGEPGACMILDVGAGITEVAVISLGEVVLAESLATGGNTLDDAITALIKRRFGVSIGEETAERIKLELASALRDPNDPKGSVTGHKAASGLPVAVEIRASEIHEAISGCLGAIVSLVHRLLEYTPPELSADLVDRGLVLTGGSGLVRNLGTVIQESVGLPVRLAADPLGAVALGGARMLAYARR
jgi:rod shape-determining protein MreB and related proteins